MHPDGMNWSWEQLQATPIEVRDLCWKFLQMQRQVALDAAAKAKREAARESGTVHIER